MIYSNSCEYAVRALSHLAGHPQALVQLKDIAEAEHIPSPFLAKILQDLVRAGLLQSAKGPKGGFMLKRASNAISLLEIKMVIDGTIALERCVLGLEHCSEDNPCSHHALWHGVRNHILNFLKSTTLEDLVAEDTTLHPSR